MIGIRSAISIRARGQWPLLEAVYMTAPRSVRRNTKKPLPRGGRPYMTESGPCRNYRLGFPGLHRDDGRASGGHAASLPLAQKFLHRDPEILGVHAIDDGVALGIQLLRNRRGRRAMDQRLGGGEACGGVLREAQRQLAGGCLQFGGRNDLGHQAPVISLLRAKTVLGEEDLQRAADADGG